ncbi:hypothetical protein D9758_007554 [Tetrapyrgos nigripes]|uniref:Ubiquitin-conjugating enzyme E2 6 n=1 Tax=Tetrapyrgos nigripes TaxID=182062 RepID=A0A8H5G812_9AGAR|nr:hypothetical protein D9758_007554 [Tetrapyrgos nigripes]
MNNPSTSRHRLSVDEGLGEEQGINRKRELLPPDCNDVPTARQSFHSSHPPPTASLYLSFPTFHLQFFGLMASKAAQKRLTKEYAAMQKEPPPFVWAVPDERNILNWNYIIRGPPDSPFAGGEYHGLLMFPSEYPFKPPGIKMLTPSGRFSPDRKICFSMSDFHPGTWNPAWSVATILTGLLSFMLSDEMTTGSVTSSDSHKRVFAARSHEWNLKQARFREAFPDYCTPSPRDLPNMGEASSSKTTDPKSFLLPPVPPLPSSATGKQPLGLGLGSISTNGSIAHFGSESTAVPANGSGGGSDNTNANTNGNSSVNKSTTNSTNGTTATGAWTQLIWDKWRWGLLIALAVVVSRLTTSRV